MDGRNPGGLRGRHNFYVAGPLSHIDPKHMARNVERAMKVTLALVKKGHLAFCPHLSYFFNEWAKEQSWEPVYEYYMALDLSIVTGWATALFHIDPSPGADRELSAALMRGIPVFDDLAKVPAVQR